MEKITLLSLFSQAEEELRNKLVGVRLPQDEEKFELILTNLFVNDIKIDAYKQELTSSELAIFQSAIHLVESTLRLSKKGEMFTLVSKNVSSISSETQKNDTILNRRITSTVVTGAGILIAGAISRYWGALLLAIVASAANYYLFEEKDNFVVKEESQTHSYLLNVDAFLNAIRELCIAIDSTMSIYWTNQENLKSRFETKNEMTLYGSYKYLLDRLAIFYRDKCNHASSEDLDEDFEKIFKTLKNYKYEFVRYSDATKDLFDVESLDNLVEPFEDEVAIVENGICIVRGKYFIPSNNLI